jgi:hypothetical protein
MLGLMNRLSTPQRVRAISALVEGVSINATCRMTGVAKHTALNLFRDLGCAAAAFHHHNVRGLKVKRLQCDEIWDGHAVALHLCITTFAAFTKHCA